MVQAMDVDVDLCKTAAEKFQALLRPIKDVALAFDVAFKFVFIFAFRLAPDFANLAFNFAAFCLPPAQPLPLHLT